MPRVASVSPDGAVLVVGFATGTVRVFSTETGAMKMRLPKDSGAARLSPLAQLADDRHADAVTCVLCTAQRIVSGSADGTLRMWHRTSGEHLCVYRASVPVGAGSRPAAPGAAVTAVAVDDSRSRWLAGYADSSIVAFDMDSALVVQRFVGGEQHPCASIVALTVVTSRFSAAATGSVPAAFSGGAPMLVSASADARLCVWCLASGMLLYGYEDVPTVCLAFDPLRCLLMSGGEDGSVRMWSVTPREARHFKRIHASPQRLASLWYDSQLDLLVAAAADGKVRVWPDATGVSSTAARQQQARARRGGPRGEALEDADVQRVMASLLHAAHESALAPGAYAGAVTAGADAGEEPADERARIAQEEASLHALTGTVQALLPSDDARQALRARLETVAQSLAATTQRAAEELAAQQRKLASQHEALLDAAKQVRSPPPPTARHALTRAVCAQHRHTVPCLGRALAGAGAGHAGAARARAGRAARAAGGRAAGAGARGASGSAAPGQ